MLCTYYSLNRSLRLISSRRSPSALASLLKGDIYIWEQGLQQLGLLQPYLQIIFDQIESNFSRSKRIQLEQKGLEYVHELLDVPSIFAFDKALIKEFSVQAHDFFKRFLDNSTSPKHSPLYYAPEAWIRIMAPQDCLTPYMDTIGNELGHLVVHNPHRDSWFSQASNVLNFWIALATVRAGNSILIYPESYYEELLTENQQLSRQQSLHRPLNFELSAGDILLFHGDHLHSSELNTTNQTRFVLSYRLTYGEPVYIHEGVHFQYLSL